MIYIGSKTTGLAPWFYSPPLVVLLQNDMKLRKQGHCAYRCEYHIVIVSKYRRKILNTRSYEYLQEVTKQVLERVPEVLILTMNHDVDQVHLHMSIPPKMRVSDNDILE